MPRRLSLARLFGATLAAVAVVVGLAFVVFVHRAELSAARTAQAGREEVAKRVHAAVVFELGRATRALDHVDHGVRSGAISIDDDRSLEASLFLEALADDHIAEVTFTRATLEGYASDGTARIARSGRRQVSVTRTTDGPLVTRVTKRRDDGDSFDVFERKQRSDGAFALTPSDGALSHGDGHDPTGHATFEMLVLKRNRGRTIWSDLHHAEQDENLPLAERRIALTVQKALDDASGTFVGVARVGLLTHELDELPRAVRAGPDDPHVVALFAVPEDEGGRPALVARLDPSDRFVTIGDDVRVVSDRPPPAVAALVASPLMRGLDPEHPNRDGALEVGSERYLATLREISAAPGGTTGWFVAVLGPEAYYTRDLRALERSFAAGFAVTLALVIAIGALTVRALRRGLNAAMHSLTRMRAFDFTSSPAGSKIQEIDELIGGLERAKTVVRAMGKYIPVELVRRLYATNEEPSLGGRLADVSMMFTDIEGFTTLAEKLPPDVLAQRLGDYLAAMTRAIEACGGTIDKYIGDAVMAIWNAPVPVQDHPVCACRAALAAMKAASELFASPAWEGLPRLVTRFGIHRAEVMVGHFGAPTRISYTALGDGVNLAARLEPLCKQYGVVVLVSEDVVASAKEAFVFRRIERVAVKGKTTGIDVYELLGAVDDEVRVERAPARTYERAFDAYLARDFAGAETMLAPLAAGDPPSKVLLARCRELALRPPPEGWSGVYVATSK
jgi:adenylate cyclase